MRRRLAAIIEAARKRAIRISQTPYETVPPTYRRRALQVRIQDAFLRACHTPVSAPAGGTARLDAARDIPRVVSLGANVPDRPNPGMTKGLPPAFPLAEGHHLSS